MSYRTHKPPLAPKPTVKQKQVGHAVPRMSSIETVEMEHSVSFDDVRSDQPLTIIT